MHFQPDTVPEPVAEVLAVPGFGDHVPGGRVHFAQSGPGPGRQAAGPLGRGHQLVEVPLPVRGVPQGHGPGHVRVVARELGAEVHGDEVAAAQRPPGRHMVGQGPVGPAGHDGVEGRLVRAQFGQAVIQRDGQPVLAQARPDQRQHVGQGLVGDPAGGRDQLQLGRILDRPQFLDFFTEGHQVGVVGRRADLLILVDGQVVGLHRQAAPPAPHGLGGQQRLDEPPQHQLQVGGVPLGGQLVAGVGGQHSPAVGGQQQGRVGAGQPGQVPDVGRSGDQDGVGFELGQLSLGPGPPGRVDFRHVTTVTVPGETPRAAAGE